MLTFGHLQTSVTKILYKRGNYKPLPNYQILPLPNDLIKGFH